MSHDTQRLRKLVNAIAIANQDPRAEGDGKALTRLTECVVTWSNIGLDEDFALYAPFAALPAMRSLHGRKIDRGY